MKQVAAEITSLIHAAAGFEALLMEGDREKFEQISL